MLATYRHGYRPRATTYMNVNFSRNSVKVKELNTETFGPKHVRILLCLTVVGDFPAHGNPSKIK